MRLVFFLACWKRPEITELCFMGLQRLMKHSDSSAFAVISEDSMIPLCEKYGIEYLMHENLPVGMKKNAGLHEVLKKDFDYLIELGSDDLMLDELLDVYKPHMEAGLDFFGARKLLMIDSVNLDCREIEFDGELAQGLGRVMSRKLLMHFAGKIHVSSSEAIISDESLISEGGEGFLTDEQYNAYEKIGFVKRTGRECSVHLWDNINRGLDNNSGARIMRNGFEYHAIETSEALMADIKGDDNIWGFNPEIGTEKDLDKFLSQLSQPERSKFFANQKELRRKRIEYA